MTNTEQGTLFNVDKVKMQRKSHKQTRRTREKGIQAYHQVLRCYRMRLDGGKKGKLTDIQAMYNISKFPKYLLPDDLTTIPLEDITLQYVTDWYKAIIMPYNKRSNEKKAINKQVVAADSKQHDEDVQTLEDIVINFFQLVQTFHSKGEPKLDDLVFRFINDVMDFYRYDDKRTISIEQL